NPDPLSRSSHTSLSSRRNANEFQQVPCPESLKLSGCDEGRAITEWGWGLPFWWWVWWLWSGFPWPRYAHRQHDHGLQEIRSEEHTSELQSLTNLVCRLL